MKLKTLILTITGFLFITLVSAQITYVFVGTFNRDKQKEGIAVYKLNSKNGNLTKTHAVSGILNPSYLAIGSDSNYLYACTESQTKNSGYISSFRFNSATGQLTGINRQKTSGENPVYLVTDKENRFLLSVNYTESGLDVFRLGKDGAIEKRVQSITYKEGSNATERQHASHSHSVIFSPDFNYILIPDLGADEIRTYHFDPLRQQPVIAESYTKNNATEGSGPRHICFHPNKEKVYCVEEIGGSLSNYEFNNGMLKLTERLMLHEGVNSDYSSADIHISHDGKFLYASNRGEENNIAIFSISASGTLHPVTYQSTLGNHPRMFGISPDDNYLIVANQLSNSLRVFKRNKLTGRLKATDQIIKIESPSCVQIKTYQ
ncbi:MAG: lactonase family protein [Chitinophagaceae bacterium]|nr:lactonase family protein [Chitinophagaceae bacterium]